MKNIFEYSGERLSFKELEDSFIKQMGVPEGVAPDIWRLIAEPELRDILQTPPFQYVITGVECTDEEMLKKEVERVLLEYRLLVLSKPLAKFQLAYGQLLRQKFSIDDFL